MITNDKRMCEYGVICQVKVIKGHNILCISDFGFARLNPYRELMETFCGSYAYAAPEILEGEMYDGGKVDIWSCGQSFCLSRIVCSLMFIHNLFSVQILFTVALTQDTHSNYEILITATFYLILTFRHSSNRLVIYYIEVLNLG